MYRVLFVALIIIISLPNYLLFANHTKTKKEKSNAYFFIGLSDCISCSNKLIKSDIQELENDGIKTNIIIKNIYPIQIKNAKKFISKYYDMNKVLFDTNSYYTKLFKVKNKTVLIITDSNGKVIESHNSFFSRSKGNICFPNDDKKTLSELLSNQIDLIKHKKTPINFTDDIPLYLQNTTIVNNTLFINDIQQDKVYEYELNGKFKKVINYHPILEKTYNNKPDSINQKNLQNVEIQAICSGFIFTNQNPLLLLHLVKDYEINYNEKKINYSYYSYDIINKVVKEILFSKKYFIQTINPLLHNNKIYMSVYDNIYHHTKHEEVKDSTCVLLKVEKGKPYPVLTLNQIEKITESIYSFSFQSEVISDGKDKIIMYNPHNSLLISLIDKANGETQIQKFNVAGKLKELFDAQKKVNKFDIYQHGKEYTYPSNIYSSSILSYNGDTYIVMTQRNVERQLEEVFIQKYNEIGNMEYEKTLLVDKDYEYINNIKLASINNQEFVFLVYSDNNILELLKVAKNLID